MFLHVGISLTARRSTSAWIILCKTEKNLTALDLENLKILILSKPWWETVDSIDAAVGEIAEKNPEVKETMVEWSKSESIWLRRVAINFQQRYKENTDENLLAEIVKNNFGSKEFFINKAIGWSLREYGKVNPKWVDDFIIENQKYMAELSIKEANKR